MFAGNVDKISTAFVRPNCHTDCRLSDQFAIHNSEKDGIKSWVFVKRNPLSLIHVVKSGMKRRNRPANLTLSNSNSETLVVFRIARPFSNNSKDGENKDGFAFNGFAHRMANCYNCSRYIIVFLFVCLFWSLVSDLLHLIAQVHWMSLNRKIIFHILNLFRQL